MQKTQEDEFSPQGKEAPHAHGAENLCVTASSLAAAPHLGVLETSSPTRISYNMVGKQREGTGVARTGVTSTEGKGQ